INGAQQDDDFEEQVEGVASRDRDRDRSVSPAKQRTAAAELDSGGPLGPQPTQEEASDAYWTWRLFRDGYTVSQVALIRRCAAVALVRQLEIASQVSHPVDPSWLAAARAVTP